MKTLLSYLTKLSAIAYSDCQINSITYQASDTNENSWELYLNIVSKGAPLPSTYVIRFINVSGLFIQDLSANLNISGIGICDKKSEGWDPITRFEIVDVENNHIRFFCEAIEIL